MCSKISNTWYVVKHCSFFTQQGGAKQNPVFCSLKHWLDVSFYLDIQACTHIYWPFCLDTERSFIIPSATNFFTSKIANFCQKNGLWKRLICAVDYVEIISEDPRITTLHASKFHTMFLHNKLPEFDAIISYSSLEHSGLGRYINIL